MTVSAASLVELLDLERIDTTLFRGRQPDTDRQRVFGGQVAAQALVGASGPSTPVPRALAALLLPAPGDTAVPIVYDVEQLRDGRSFATRRVVARQHGRPIFFLTASFQRAEEGLDHQDRDARGARAGGGPRHGRPDAPQGHGEADALAKEWASLDARYVGHSGNGLPDDRDHPSRARLWIRVGGGLGDDPHMHLAAFTYASDIALLGASLVPTASPRPASRWPRSTTRCGSTGRSRPTTGGSTTAVAGRPGRPRAGLARVFTPDGRLVATPPRRG